MSAFVATYLAVVPPQDDATRRFFIIAAAIIGAATIVGIVTFAFAEYFRDREREKRERKRDKTLKKLLAKMAAMTQPEPLTGAGPIAPPAPSIEPPPPVTAAATLRQAGFDLAKEIYDFLDTVPKGLSVEDEHNRVFEYFLKTFYARLDAIKDRFEPLLPQWTVVSPAEWLPTSKAQIKKIADNLMKESDLIKPDVPY